MTGNMLGVEPIVVVGQMGSATRAHVKNEKEVSTRLSVWSVRRLPQQTVRALDDIHVLQKDKDTLDYCSCSFHLVADSADWDLWVRAAPFASLLNVSIDDSCHKNHVAVTGK